MEQCPNCGQPIRATARFCTNCGYRIPERPQGSTSRSTSGLAPSTWIEDSPGASQSSAEAPAAAASTWPAAAPEAEAPAPVEWAAPATAAPVEVVETAESAAVYAPPVVAPDPIDEIVAATAGFNADEDTIVERSTNQVNIALYHIETLRQLLPSLTDWSEDRAEAVNNAIEAMEAAIAGRESDDAPFESLRQTVAAARKDPRDIDVMIALSDRSKDIEDLLAAHDKYSIGIRNALIELKPVAVDYVRVPKKRAPARKTTSTRSRSTTSKSSSSTTSKSTSSGTSRTRKTSTTTRSS